jgi:phosphoglycerate dehydrogenase-like enzyme
MTDPSDPIARLAPGLARGGAGLRCLIHADDPSPGMAVVARALPEAELIAHDSYDGMAEVLAASRPQLCLSYRFGPGYPRAPLLEGPHAPAYIHVAGTGFDHLLPFDPDVVLVCNSAGFQAGLMADYAAGAVLAINLDLPRLMGQQVRHEWIGRTLRRATGQRAVVLGTGPIGAAISRALAAIGLEVTGVSRSGRSHPDFPAVRPVADLDRAVAGADHLIVAIPLTEESRGLVSAAILDALPEGGGVTNLARGGIVDEAALLEQLRSGRLRGAVFDVFAEEPLPPDDPLWDAPGMIVTPHSSALFDGWEAAAAEVFADNLARMARGEAPANRVDPTRGY